MADACKQTLLRRTGDCIVVGLLQTGLHRCLLDGFSLQQESVRQPATASPGSRTRQSASCFLARPPPCRLLQQPDRHRGQQNQCRHAQHHRAPGGHIEQQQGSASAQNQAHARACDLDGIAHAALARCQQAHGEAIGGDVLRGAGKGQQHQQRGKQHRHLRIAQQRGLQPCQPRHADQRNHLHRQDPAAAQTDARPVIAVLQRCPQELEAPGHEQHAAPADQHQRGVLLTQDDGQRLRDKTYRQPLGQIQRQ